MIQNATIRYTLKLTQAEDKVIKLDFEIDDLEEDDISDRLIEDGYYESMAWPTDYYEVLEREIILH